MSVSVSVSVSVCVYIGGGAVLESIAGDRKGRRRRCLHSRRRNCSDDTLCGCHHSCLQGVCSYIDFFFFLNLLHFFYVVCFSYSAVATTPATRWVLIYRFIYFLFFYACFCVLFFFILGRVHGMEQVSGVRPQP